MMEMKSGVCSQTDQEIHDYQGHHRPSIDHKDISFLWSLRWIESHRAAVGGRCSLATLDTSDFPQRLA